MAEKYKHGEIDIVGYLFKMSKVMQPARVCKFFKAFLINFYRLVQMINEYYNAAIYSEHCFNITRSSAQSKCQSEACSADGNIRGRIRKSHDNTFVHFDTPRRSVGTG